MRRLKLKKSKWYRIVLGVTWLFTSIVVLHILQLKIDALDEAMRFSANGIVLCASLPIVVFNAWLFMPKLTIRFIQEVFNF